MAWHSILNFGLFRGCLSDLHFGLRVVFDWFYLMAWDWDNQG